LSSAEKDLVPATEAQLMAQSYVPALERLSSQQRGSVDLRIKQLLFDAQFTRSHHSQAARASSSTSTVDYNDIVDPESGLLLQELHAMF
jgi:hypothetical protein